MAASERTSHLAYDELASPEEMSEDARAVGRNLRLPATGAPDLDRPAEVAVTAAPGLAYDDFPREVVEREIRVSDAAARLANALHLHVD